MAKSITIKASGYDGRYMELVCTQTSNGAAKNSSTINWTLSTKGGSVNLYATGPTKVIIDGATVYSKDRVSIDHTGFPVSKGSVSGSLVVNHDNTGKREVSVKLSTAIYYKSVDEYSEKWTLDSIPRYATVAHSLNAKTETTVKMNWSSDSLCDYLAYSVDNGEIWTRVDEGNGKSGTYTISLLKPNTAYKVLTRVRRKDSQLWTTTSTAVSVTTYDYPYCTSSPNFILGNDVTLQFYNPLKRSFVFYIIGNGTQINVEYKCSTTSYSGVSSKETSVPYLYATIPNAKSGKYQVKVVYGSSTKTRNNGNTYTIKESECYPTFPAFTYKDTNAKVTAVTGNNQALVKGLSSLSVEVSSANKMVTKNSAVPDYYGVSVDTINKTEKYDATSAVTIPVGVISSAGQKRLTVRGYDSRGVSTAKYKDVTVYEYNKPKIEASATRLNNFEAQTTLKIGGTYDRLTIGGADKNTIKKVSYRYRQKGGTWPTATELTKTVSAGKFSCADLTLSFDISKAFEIEVIVEDNLSTNNAIITVDVGEAIFFISSNKKTAYVNGEEVATKNFVGDAIGALATGTIATEAYVTNVIKALYPVGTVVCTSTNKNPSTIYGGTWTLIDKGFKAYSVYTPSMFTADANVVADTVYLSRGANTIRIRLSLVVNTAISDTGLTLGTLNWSVVGVTGLHAGIIEKLAYRDGANGGIVYSVFHESGGIQIVDVFDTASIATGATFYLDFTFVSDYTRMLDSVCDKFYWKRTA